MNLVETGCVAQLTCVPCSQEYYGKHPSRILKPQCIQAWKLIKHHYHLFFVLITAESCRNKLHSCYKTAKNNIIFSREFKIPYTILVLDYI